MEGDLFDIYEFILIDFGYKFDYLMLFNLLLLLLLSLFSLFSYKNID